ncbi:unnamed protein product, partial [Mycena citricolor]
DMYQKFLANCQWAANDRYLGAPFNTGDRAESWSTDDTFLAPPGSPAACVRVSFRQFIAGTRYQEHWAVGGARLNKNMCSKLASELQLLFGPTPDPPLVPLANQMKDIHINFLHALNPRRVCVLAPRTRQLPLSFSSEKAAIRVHQPQPSHATQQWEYYHDPGHLGHRQDRPPQLTADSGRVREVEPAQFQSLFFFWTLSI